MMRWSVSKGSESGPIVGLSGPLASAWITYSLSIPKWEFGLDE